MTDLESRLDRLEAQSQITSLLHRYGAAIDYGDEAGWVDCFTEDGVFEIEVQQSDTRRVAGRGSTELAAFAAGHTRVPEAFHKHMTVDPLIEIDGDAATCRSYFVVLIAGGDGKPAIVGFGRYSDTLQRGPDGRWRFTHRCAETEGVDRQWNLRR